MSRADGAGPVALVGSGEFLEVMVPVDAELLAGRPQRAIFLPTASAEEGPERVRYWTDLAIAHYASMGVEPVALEVLDREDADSPELALKVAGAGLVYLSGGNPGYLANTLAGTAVWQAILQAWRSGAALAGCSAGACALSRLADDFRRPGRYSGEGLAVVPQLVVLPHFDRFENWMPGLVERMVARTPPDAALVGIDEETALIWSGNSFTVRGKKSVWMLDRDGTRLEFRAGQRLELPATVPRMTSPRRRATHAK
ncbi:MAG: Type 1 glutamine amidotransferase-like domain-containing protein [Acidimicrobiales bacterium]